MDTPCAAASDRVAGPQLAASVRFAVETAAELDAADRMARVVLAAHLPATSGSTSPVRTLLTRRGAVILGSRGAAAGDLPALYVAADLATWEEVAVWLDRHPLPRPLAGFTLSRAVVGAGEVRDNVWEAVLHPDVDASGPTRMRAAGDRQCAAFVDAVARAGGDVARRRLATGTLTYAAVRLPDVAAAQQLAAFNPLRSLRPMGYITLR